VITDINSTVGSVECQEDLERQFPPGRRLQYRIVRLQPEKVGQASSLAGSGDVPPALALRYDFKRSEQNQSIAQQVCEKRREKLPRPGFGPLLDYRRS
jgi:hypothetical protein